MWGESQQDMEDDEHCVCATGPGVVGGVMLQGEGGREGAVPWEVGEREA